MLCVATSMAEMNCRVRRSAAAHSSAAGTRTVLRVSPSNLRAYSRRPLSPRLRTASRIGRTTASASAMRAERRARSLPVSEDLRIRIMSHHYLVERVLNNSFGAGLLQARDDRSDGRFVENRVDCQPLLIAQMGNSWSLERRQDVDHSFEVVLMDVQHETHFAQRGDGAIEEELQIL